MKKLQLCLLILTAVFATGCPKYRPKVDFENPGSFIGKLNAHIKSRHHDYECYRFGPSYPSTLGSCSGYTLDLEKAKGVRNELLEEALPFIDSAYIDFITDIQAGRDRDNFIADVIELGTTGAVGITNGERPLQILGVALTAFRGGRRSADLNFYKEQATPVLISKMDGNRAKVRTTILEREKQKVEDYPLGAAIADIVDYYNAGTLVRAFTELQKDTSVQTKQAEDDLKTLKKNAGIRPAPTDAEIKISRENADAIDALVQAYIDADDQVTAADAKVNAAQTAINTATQAGEAAAGRIAEATQRINAATTQAARTQAQADKTNAEADKTNADANKTKAEAEKTQAEAAKTAAVKARDTALSNLRGTYSAIESDSSLGPLLAQIPDSDPDYSDQFRTELRTRLKRLKENKTTPESDKPTVEDYANILLKVGKMVRENFSTDPTLNERLRKILKVNK